MINPATPRALQPPVPIKVPQPRVTSGTTQYFQGAEALSLLRVTNEDPQEQFAYVYWDPQKNNPSPISDAVEFCDSSGLELAAYGRIKIGNQGTYTEILFDIPWGQLIEIPVVGEQFEVTAQLGRPYYPAGQSGQVITADNQGIIQSNPGFFTPNAIAGFVQPAVGANTGALAVTSTVGALVNGYVWIPGGGIYRIFAVGVGVLTLTNLGMNALASTAFPHGVAAPGVAVAGASISGISFVGAFASYVPIPPFLNTPFLLFLPPTVTLPTINAQYPTGFVAISGMCGFGSSGLRGGISPSRRIRLPEIAPASSVLLSIPFGANRVRTVAETAIQWNFQLASLRNLGPMPNNSVEGFPIPMQTNLIQVDNTDGALRRGVEFVFEFGL